MKRVEKYSRCSTNNSLICQSISEKYLRDELVIPLAKLKGWKVFFAWKSLHSPSGLVDLILIRDKVLWRELKSERGKVTVPQEECIRLLKEAKQDVKVWKPSDWDSIVEELS